MSTEYASSVVSSTENPARPLFGKTPRDTAVCLEAAGLWPVPLYRPGVERKNRDVPTTGKEPFGPEWGLVRNTLDTIHSKFKHRNVGGCGVGLGPGRGPGGAWLGDFEGDGPKAEESRQKLLGGEVVEGVGWSATRGDHKLFLIDETRWLPLAARLAKFEGKGETGTGVYKFPGLPDLELRIGGFKTDGTVKQVQSVCPPTIGTDGQPRVANGRTNIPHAPDAFYECLARIADEAERPELADEKPAEDTWSMTVRAAPDVEERAIKYLAKCDPAVSGQGGHNTAFKAACKVGPGFGLAPEVAYRLLKDYYNPRCQPPWSEAELRHKVEDAYATETRRGFLRDAERNGKHQGNGKATAGNTRDGDQGQAATELPPIEINTERHRVLSEALDVLPSDADLFSRGNVLVRITAETNDKAKLAGGVTITKAINAPRVVAITEAGLGCRLTALADLFAWRKTRSGEFVAEPAHPPAWLLKALVDHAEYPGVRPLRAIALSPFPRADGTIVSTPGYDPETGVYLAAGVKLRPLPDRPSQADAIAAYGRLTHVVKDFPFVAADDKAVWVAGLLTVVARHAIGGPVPGVSITSNLAGTGKGRLVDTIGTIAEGRCVPCTGYPETDDEVRKLKTALALEATSIIHLDNLEEGRTYGGGALDSALTSLEVSERILGQSRTTGRIELRTCWFLTGNNIGPRRDAYRRWLVCNLETKLERPEERSDIEHPDLLGYVLQNRAGLLRDALIILKAHAVAGRPSGGWPPLGSFEQWDHIVRGAVWFASGLDCNRTRRKAAEESPDRLARLVLMDAWAATPDGGENGRGMTVPDAIRLATPSTPGAHFDTRLADALMLFSRNGKIEPRVIGNTMRAMAGRPIRGRKFAKASSTDNYVRWRVEPADPAPAESGESTESDSHTPREGLRSHSDVMAHAPCVNGFRGTGKQTPQTMQTQPGTSYLEGEL